MSVGMLNGADEENRTPVSTMARSCSTIELHPQNKKMAVQTGLEPATPSVTGRYANQLRHWTMMAEKERFELSRQFPDLHP